MTVFHINPAAPAVTEEREPLFYIGDQEFTIPKRVGGEVLLEAMELARELPDAAVTAWCCEQLLTPTGWKALRGVKGLDPAVMQGIMKVCREKVFGTMEEEGKG